MKRWEAWMVHTATLLVGGTGAVYAVMRYLLSPVDDFSVVNHPLQPTFQHLHVLMAPLLVFAAGLIWRGHVWSHWTGGRPQRRRSGLALLSMLVPMIVSGYLIQTTVTATWRNVWIIVHLITSTLWILGYAVHWLAGWHKQRRAIAPRVQPSPSVPPPG
ncbi:MAG: hypothetical protein K8J08_08140 [Thermoanaerobaculia bacterium]|nr:hypothetical protein [Thermoanaerobaculia bacterium]